jgi:glycosyltransferase involved in cell wall biosynthesis
MSRVDPLMTTLAEARVLIVSYHFAPQAVVGAKRFTFLSDILSDHLARVHVLTVEPAAIGLRDPGLKTRATVHRTGTLVRVAEKAPSGVAARALRRLWMDYACVLDPYSGWIVPALWRGRSLLEKESIDLIVATGPPFCAHVVAWLLHRGTGRPLILDYRDPWIGTSRRLPRIWGRWSNRSLERKTARAATRLVVTTPAMRESFRGRLGEDVAARTAVITNGYHPRTSGRRQRAERFAIAYAGAMYGERRLQLIAGAVRRLLDEGLIKPESFTFHIFGDTRAENRQVLSDLGVQVLFREHGFLSHERLLDRLEDMDALAMMIGDSMAYSISYKFFDYLSLHRPILAIAPAGSQMEATMCQLDCGIFADIHEPESIYRGLRTIVAGERQFTFRGAEQFTWQNVGRQYLDVMGETLGTEASSARAR